MFVNFVAIKIPYKMTKEQIQLTKSAIAYVEKAKALINKVRTQKDAPLSGKERDRLRTAYALLCRTLEEI